MAFRWDGGHLANQFPSRPKSLIARPHFTAAIYSYYILHSIASQWPLAIHFCPTPQLFLQPNPMASRPPKALQQKGGGDDKNEFFLCTKRKRILFFWTLKLKLKIKSITSRTEGKGRDYLERTEPMPLRQFPFPMSFVLPWVVGHCV